VNPVAKELWEDMKEREWGILKGEDPQAAQTHVTRCNVIYILTFGEAEYDL